MLQMPAHLVAWSWNRPALAYVWDDTRASDDFGYDARWLLQDADPCSLRAQMALCVALYETVAWRFHGLHDRAAPLQLLQAGWVGTLDPRLLADLDLPREQWTGPVLGPLWCAAVWLWPALQEGDARLAEVADALDYLSRLAMHVAPEPALLDAWLHAVVGRLREHHPPATDALALDPYADLFDRRIGQRRGPLVHRALFDAQPAAALERADDPWQALQPLGAPWPVANPWLAPRADPSWTAWLRQPRPPPDW